MGGDEIVYQAGSWENIKTWMLKVSSNKDDGVHVEDSLNAGPVTYIKHGVVDV